MKGILTAQRVEPNATRSFGIIDTHQDGQVAGIRQRPDPSTVTDPLALVSRLLLRPDILDQLVPSESARGEVDLGIAVGHLATESHVRVHEIAGHWVTVGNPHHYFDALQTYWHHSPLATGRQGQP